MLKNIVNKMMETLSKYSVQQEDVVGIDITPGSIRVAQVEKTGDKWLLSKLSYKYIDDELSGTIRDNAPAYVEKLKAAIQGGKITTTNAAVSIPVSSAIVKVVTLPLMTDEELQEAVDTDSLWENVIQLTDTLEDYSIFWQVIGRNQAENMMDLLFVASKLEDINFYLDLVKQAELNPVIVDVRCFAMKNAIEMDKAAKERGKTIALLEIGPYENYMLILRDEAPFISAIFVTDADKHAMSNPQLPADEAKKIADRLAMQVKQTVSTYEARFKGIPVDEVLLVSSSASTDSLFAAMQQSMSPMKTTVFNSTKPVTIPAQLNDKVKAEPNRSVFATALGLATRKLDVFGYYQYVTGVNNINLLPNRDSVKNVERTKLLSKFGLIAGGVITAIVIAYLVISQYTADEDASNELTEYYTLETEKMDLQMQIDEMRQKQQQLSGMLDASKGLVSNQKAMYQLLVEITQAFPEGVWLESIDYAGTDKLVLDGRSVSDQNILEFIGRLSSSRYISRASLNTMTIVKQGGREIKKFSLTANLESFDMKREEKVKEAK